MPLVAEGTAFVRLDHVVEMHELLPDSRLAVPLGVTRTGLTRRGDLLVPMVEPFPSRSA